VLNPHVSATHLQGTPHVETLTEQDPHPQLEQSPEHEQEEQSLRFIRQPNSDALRSTHHGAGARPDASTRLYRKLPGDWKGRTRETC
jgi:hypothetical protein